MSERCNYWCQYRKMSGAKYYHVNQNKFIINSVRVWKLAHNFNIVIRIITLRTGLSEFPLKNPLWRHCPPSLTVTANFSRASLTRKSHSAQQS